MLLTALCLAFAQEAAPPVVDPVADPVVAPAPVADDFQLHYADYQRAIAAGAYGQRLERIGLVFFGVGGAIVAVSGLSLLVEDVQESFGSETVNYTPGQIGLTAGLVTAGLGMGGFIVGDGMVAANAIAAHRQLNAMGVDSSPTGAWISVGMLGGVVILPVAPFMLAGSFVTGRISYRQAVSAGQTLQIQTRFVPLPNGAALQVIF